MVATSPAGWAARLRQGSHEYLLFPGQILRLGRADTNDIVLDDLKVSRAHALLEWNGAGFTLRDLGSANGTFVNGARLSVGARLLIDGDQVRLGTLELVYEIARTPEPDVAAADQPQSAGDFAASTPANEPAASEPAALKPADTEPSPQGAFASPSLLVTRGPDLGQEYPLWGETVTIGRASREATWEIRLTDRSVSRPHARLERREDGYVLFDLDSANGTLINGAPVVDQTLLKDGDVISVGETSLTFHLYQVLQSG